MALPQHKHSQQDFFDRADPKPEADVITMTLPEPAQNERQSRQSTLRVGEVLKRERERRGYDLQQIADYLCIRRSLLLALENSNYDEFPADAYVIGFLRSYAELIGLDGQEAINHYRQEMSGRRKQPDLIVPTPISEGRAPTAVIMGAAALASLLVYILWYAFSSSDRTSVSTPPVLPATTEAPAATTTTPAVTGSNIETVPTTAPYGIAIAAPAPQQKTMTATTDAATSTTSVQPAATSNAPTPTTTGAARITIKAEQSSWILIANNKGQTLYDHVMKPDEVYQVPNTQGLTLTTGNGAGIVLTVDGVEVPRLSSTTSHIVRNVPLDAQSLKSLPAQPVQ